MQHSIDDCTILFVDIVDSVSLYEAIGDQAASATVLQCLTALQAIVLANSGRVVKTIGDALMCEFNAPECSVRSAIGMQEQVKNRRFNGHNITVRIGIHQGPAIANDGDLLGDSVNLAARIAALAGSQKILTTEALLSSLGSELASKARLIERRAIKGKSLPVNIYEVVWEASNATVMLKRAAPVAVVFSGSLVLSYRGKNLQLPATGSLSLGRSPDCDLVIASQLASRNHATVTRGEGTAILTDQSTNGTFVRFDSGRTLHLKRESAPLEGGGTLSMGDEDVAEHRVLFTID